MRTLETGGRNNPMKKRYGHKKFYELLDQAAELHSRKNHDYSSSDPLSNLRECEDMGIPAWKGVIVRLGDKYSRLKHFAKSETLLVRDESVKDTLMDTAIYALLAYILYEEKDKSNENLPKV